MAKIEKYEPLEDGILPPDELEHHIWNTYYKLVDRDFWNYNLLPLFPENPAPMEVLYNEIANS